jgi:hypothetical protein
MPRSVMIFKSHWLVDSLASARGHRTPDGPPNVSRTRPLPALSTVAVGIKQEGNTRENSHVYTSYTVSDVIQEVISYAMFPVHYICHYTFIARCINCNLAFL